MGSRLRPGSPHPLFDALLVVGIGMLCAAGAQLAALLHGGAPWVADLFPLVAVVYAGAGIFAWRRRPSSRLGALLVVAGGLWLVGGLANIAVPSLAAISLIARTVPLAVIVHLLLTFPTGRVRDRASRAVIAAGYFVSTVLQVPLYVFTPGSILVIAVRPDLAHAGLQVQRAAGALVTIATAMLLTGQMQRGTAARRRVLAPLTVYGIFALLLIPASSAVATAWFHGGGLWLPAAQLTLMSFVPLAFVAAASRGGFERTSEVAELGGWLGADEIDRPELRDALSAALGDPSLQLLFRLPEEDGLIDDRGVTVQPQAIESRGCVDIMLAGRAIGSILYDAALLDRPDEVREAGRVVALAVDRQRLAVRLRASRARIAAAADDERRRIARDLHDGLQSRLVFLAVQAGAGADPLALRTGLQAAIDELRELVDGVMPAQLTERGLPAAVAELADRLPTPITLRIDGLEQRLAPEIEAAAYFVVSEAIVNAVKHSGSAELGITLHRTNATLHIEVSDAGAGGARLGAGVRGMADRVAAVAGHLTLDSPCDRGTRIQVVIPCAS
jgi:signal transduction histidine kinase